MCGGSDSLLVGFFPAIDKFVELSLVLLWYMMSIIPES